MDFAIGYCNCIFKSLWHSTFNHFFIYIHYHFCLTGRKEKGVVFSNYFP